MKQILFKIVYFSICGLILSYVIYNGVSIKRPITQTVRKMTQAEKHENWVKWKDSPNNPYDTKETLYVLTTLTENYGCADYGTEKEIAELKCVRYAEHLIYLKNDSLQAIKEEKEEQHSKEVIKRLNDIDCK